MAKGPRHAGGFTRAANAAGRVVVDSTDLMRVWSLVALASALRKRANTLCELVWLATPLARTRCLQHAGSRRGCIAEGRVFINNVGCQSPKFLFTRITPPDAGGLAPNAEVEFHGTGTPRFSALVASPSRTTQCGVRRKPHEPTHPPFFAPVPASYCVVLLLGCLSSAGGGRRE